MTEISLHLSVVRIRKQNKIKMTPRALKLISKDNVAVFIQIN